MQIHIVIYGMAAVLSAGVRSGRIRAETTEKKKVFRLLLLLLLAGNTMGTLLTLTESGPRVFPKETALPKKEFVYQESLAAVWEGEELEIDLQVPAGPASEEEKTAAAEEDASLSPEKELEKAVILYNNEKEDPAYYHLPDEWQGKALTWKEKESRNGQLLSGLCVLGGALLLIAKRREEQQAVNRRQAQLLADYPGMVMKFTLLLNAGMSIRQALRKITLDMRQDKKREERPVCRELLRFCREVESGLSQTDAFRSFGERCGQIRYRSFSTLLIQNLRRGGAQLTELLEREAQDAWEERKRRARTEGEEASTKLLLPMAMLLMVVMAVIMIPAFLSFMG